MNGFVRVIYSDGSYFIGFYKDHIRHGKGKQFDADGKLDKEGMWENDVFVE